MYTGKEPAIELKRAAAIETDSVFEVPLFRIPNGAVPVYDQELSAVVGYRHETTTGVFRLYDLEGNYVGMEEVGLESPLLDPIDLIVLFGGLLRGVGKGLGSIAARSMGRGSIVIGGRALSSAVTGAMRAAFRGLSVKSLKFTATTAARMATPGRYVPVHILHLAVKYGRRAADPQKIEGAFLYTIKMLKNGKGYALEVVVREKDWTILHFSSSERFAMSRARVPVEIQPRTQACHAVTAWHSDSALLVCSFGYTADTAPVPATVAEHIDAALGISTAAPRALLGNIDVAWRDESRLHSIELRTGRGQWQPASLRTPTDSLEASSMTFGLDYDINRVASVDLEFAVLWDATRSRLALRFDTAAPANVRWVAIADTVFACVDSEQSLIEIQFDSVAIVAADPPN